MKIPPQIKPPENWQDFETHVRSYGVRFGVVQIPLKKMVVQDKINVGLMFMVHLIME